MRFLRWLVAIHPQVTRRSHLEGWGAPDAFRHEGVAVRWHHGPFTVPKQVPHVTNLSGNAFALMRGAEKLNHDACPFLLASHH